jgi:hypothetical protein
MASQRSRQAIFDRVQALRTESRTAIDIVRETGLSQRTITKWLQADTLPQRSASAPKTCSPRFFEDYPPLDGRLRARTTSFSGDPARGYTGSMSHLQRLLAQWRNPKRTVARPVLPASGAQPVDPTTG